MSLIVDPVALSLILAWPHPFVEFDDEVISVVILLLPLNPRRVVSVVHEVLANPLVKLNHEKFD